MTELPSTARPRIGVVGCGLISQIMHLPYLRELDDHFELYALCDVSPGTLAAMGRRYAVSRLYTRWEEMLDEPLDAVLVATNVSHAPVAIGAIQRGLAVLSEKPLCYTTREADEINQAATQVGVPVMVGYMKRYDPAYAGARDAIANIGPLQHVVVTTLSGPLSPYVSHHRIDRVNDVPASIITSGESQRAELVGEALGIRATREIVTLYHDTLLDSAIHELNLLNGLLGPAQHILAADAWADGLSFSAILEFPANVRVTLSFVSVPEFRGWRQDLSFYGPAASATLRFPSPFLRNEPTTLILEGTRGSDIRREEIVFSLEEAFKIELMQFHQVVVRGQQPIVGVDEARLDIRTAIAIARSALEHRPVAIS